MKKILFSLCVLASSLSAENYISFGAGPYVLQPSIGIGYRGDIYEMEKTIVKYDITGQVSTNIREFTATLQAASIINFRDSKYYFGPSLSYSHYYNKYYRSDEELNLGVIIGHTFEGSFLDVCFEKIIYSKNYTTEMAQAKVRYGIFF